MRALDSGGARSTNAPAALHAPDIPGAPDAPGVPHALDAPDGELDLELLGTQVS